MYTVQYMYVCEIAVNCGNKNGKTYAENNLESGEEEEEKTPRKIAIYDPEWRRKKYYMHK